MASMRELAIREYISNIDFRNDDWKISQLKQDMRRFLGEEPGIDIIYKKDVMVSEFTGESKEFVDLEKIQIVFTDDDNKFKKLEFILSESI